LTEENTVNALEQLEQEPNDDLSFPVPSTKDLGWLLVGGGAVGALVTLLRGQRDVSDWIIPVGLIGLGSGILLKRRQTHIEEAEQSILAELDSLDPIARAQVLKTVAKDQIGRIPGVGSSSD
jgi:hypothetical protein